ncbi:MAG TPA: S8 family peptidase [Candidatus Obscuribacterales bacterium]
MKSAKSIASLTLAAVAVSALAACQMQTLPPGAPVGVRGQATNSGGLVPGKVIVKYRAGVRNASAQASSSLSRIGAQRVRTLGSAASGMEVVQIPAGQNVAAAVQTLEQNPAIEFAEPVFTIPFPKVLREGGNDAGPAPATYPNDSMFAKQYSHRVTNSQAGWELTKGSPRVLIGVVDSGVDVTHPDLRAKIVDTFNSADNNKDVKDFVGHGTHVAGIASAMTNNGMGVAGVAPECGILAVKVASGDSGYPSTEGIANGVMWAADHGAQVINLSLGSRQESKAITDAVKYALSKNVTVVAATGNDGGRVMSYPAAVPGVVAVGATDSKDARARYSNYGPWVSVTAPGSDILSTFPLNTNLIGQTEYGQISGTSMATPFVTGLAALIRSKYPTMPQVMVKQVLESSTDDKGKPGFDEEYGHGRVNVAKALTRAGELSNGGATGTPPALR